MSRVASSCVEKRSNMFRCSWYPPANKGVASSGDEDRTSELSKGTSRSGLTQASKKSKLTETCAPTPDFTKVSPPQLLQFKEQLKNTLAGIIRISVSREAGLVITVSITIAVLPLGGVVRERIAADTVGIISMTVSVSV